MAPPIRRLSDADRAYPEALRDLRSPPSHLYAIGALDALGMPLVAIVGTRDATAYGERVARDLVLALVRAGACIVSGLARGIDATAHRAALEAGGRTIAVLGTGVDVPYPAGHRALHEAIAEHGLLLSEFEPGARAVRGCFPRRNRIIAALARLTIVVEAGHRSGALITAVHALEIGRDVAAVPGRIDSPASAGSNVLLRDGAHVLATPDDAVALAGLEPLARAPLPALEGAERVVWDALAAPSPSLEELISRTRLPVAECLSAVSRLELLGRVAADLTGELRRG